MSAGRERPDAAASPRRLQVAISRLKAEIAELPIDPDRHRTLNDRLDDLALAATASDELAAAIIAALDRLGIGVALLDAQGHFVWSNRYMNHVLAQDDGLTITHGRLSANSSTQAGEITRLVARVRDGSPPDDDQHTNVLAIERQDHRQPFLLAAFRLQRPVSSRQDEHDPILVCVADPERPVSLPPRDLEDLFGLTPAESQIASLLAAGDRLDLSAEKLGVTTGTARTHLKHMFEKTGTGRQSELSRLLQTLHARIDFD